MDGYEATKIVFSRIQCLDPENASKIMGLLLLQDHCEKEMIRLAFGPETLVHSVIIKAKKELGLMSTPRSAWCDLSSQEELISPKNGASVLNPSSLPFYANGKSSLDVMDDFHLQDQLSFLNDSNPTTNLAGSLHGSNISSISDILETDDSDLGFGWRPCLYSPRGFCKHGGSCRFVQGGGDRCAVDGGVTMVGSPGKIEMTDTCHELIRSKAADQRPRFGNQLMGGSCFPYSPKSMNLLLHHQQSETQRAAALIMSEDLNKFGRSAAMASPASRQIYLTFPADSTFREEDVSNYFSTYGPVQDVRIPYQQKRMFGFVTFVYPETVKMILAKGNPHFVCDSRVLVKPYKEKGKVPDKYRSKQLIERAEFSPPCGSPSALESREPFDLPLGPRMIYNTQDLLWRRRLEEQAIELQSRRLMNLQLDLKKHYNHNNLSVGSPVPSPTHLHSPSLFNQSRVLSPFLNGQESPRPDNCPSPLLANSVIGSLKNKQPTNEVAGKESLINGGNGDGKQLHDDKINLPESLEHNLPDSPFAPTTDDVFLFDDDLGDAENNNNNNASASSSSSEESNSTSAIDIGSFNSFNCQMPRLSSGHGAIGMLPGSDSGGPTCPVGI